MPRTADHIEADLAEHKIGTELDRLAATELARMRRAIAAKERREQSRYISAALADVAGTRYTPGELAAACGGAIHAALQATRGMRLTADDWADLRSDLMLAAIRHGADCDASRNGATTLPGERTGTGSPADVQAYVKRWERMPALLRRTVGDPDNARMPRREDLAGKEQRDPGAYLHGAARNLVAKIAERGATDTAQRASEAEVESAAAKDTPADPLSMEELGAALKVSKRERWALDAAAGTAPAELAAEHGKSLGAMRTALDKGRNSLRARIDADTLRTIAADLRKAPDPSAAPNWTITMRRHDRVIEVPATVLEAADAFLRWTSDTRRNTKMPRSTGGYLVTDHPTALVTDADGRSRIVPAIGPPNVRTLAADLPTLDRRAINGHRLWTALDLRNRPCRPVKYSAPRPYRAEHIDLTGATYWPVPAMRPPIGHPASDYVSTYDPNRETRPTGSAAAIIPTRTASGPITPAVQARLTASRLAAINANRKGRTDALEAAKRAGKLIRLPAGN